MFEGKPPQAFDSRSSAAPGDMPEDKLCEMSWGDLVAKLAAARELRAELAHGDDEPLASFDALSARHLAALHDPQRGGEDEHRVNPDDLGNGKAEYGIRDAAVDRETPGTRGIT